MSSLLFGSRHTGIRRWRLLFFSPLHFTFEHFSNLQNFSCIRWRSLRLLRGEFNIIVVLHKQKSQMSFLSVFHKRWVVQLLLLTLPPPLVSWAKCWFRPLSIASDADPLTPVGPMYIFIMSVTFGFSYFNLSYILNQYFHLKEHWSHGGTIIAFDIISIKYIIKFSSMTAVLQISESPNHQRLRHW